VPGQRPGRAESRTAAGIGILLAIAAVVAGCGYGFSASLLPGHIKSVAIPLMENRTDRSDLTTAFADSLVEAFLADPTLKVADERSADSVLEGAILEYRREPFRVDANENVLEYSIRIILEARFVDLRKNEVIWEEARLNQWDTYDFESGETEEEGIARVLVKLTDDVLNRTVEGW
jgi:hypothetical protein